MTKNKFDKVIGANIRKFRKELGLSQEQLGDAIGLSRVSVVNIENGKQSTPLYTVFEICTVLVCKPSDLFPPIPKSPAQRAVVHVSFTSKSARKKCLNDPEFNSTMNKLITKAYYTTTNGKSKSNSKRKI